MMHIKPFFRVRKEILVSLVLQKNYKRINVYVNTITL